MPYQRFFVSVSGALLGAFLLANGACSKRSLTPQGPVAPVTSSVRESYLNEVGKRISEWREILRNLRTNQNMYPVNSDVYRKRGETIVFLEKHLKDIDREMNQIKTAPGNRWEEHRSLLDVKLAQMKELYYRPPAE